jgi:RNA polymerase sigma-70 factor (ECF subfamily)
VEDVIGHARTGDRDALGQMWRAYNHMLLRYFRGKGMADPDDLASTVWVEVASSLHRFEGSESDFRRWLFTIATRRRIDDIRAVKRRDGYLELQRQTARTHSSPSAAQVADQEASLERAIALVRTLPPDQAEAVLLRVVADLNVADVAKMLGKREGTIRVLVHRGLSRLAERSGEAGPEEIPHKVGFGVTEPPPRTMSEP